MSSREPKVMDLKPRLAVIGVGGAGGNAINNMIAAGLDGVDFIVANTDAQALIQSSAEHRIQLGVHVTEGLGAGSKPEVGEAAAEEAVEEVRAAIKGAHMVFIAAGMGGGTGTGAAAVIARTAKEAGVLTVGIVTKPFQFEGARRMRIAEAGIEELKKSVDTLIVIPNQNLFRIANEKTTFAEAFVLADQVLYSGIACIVDLIIKEGLINLDFADVRTILTGMGTAMMGTGEGSGERRAILAAEEAIANPLLDDVSLKGAKGLLLSILGGRNLTLYEVDEAASRVRQEVDSEANIIVGATFDDSLGDKVRVSIVASGLSPRNQQRSQPPTPAPAQAPTPPVELPAAKPLPSFAPPPAAAMLQPSPIPSGRPPVVGMNAAPAPGPAQRPNGPQPASTQAHQSQRTDEMDAAELQRRLSVALQLDTDGRDEDAGEGSSAQHFDPKSTIAGEPWRAPGDVMIEEGLPHLSAPPEQRQSPAAAKPAPSAPQNRPQEPFRPAAPEPVRRPQQRRMPDVDDFPPIGQKEYRAKSSTPQGGAPASDRQGGKPQVMPEPSRRPGLIERWTGLGRRPAESPAPPPLPQTNHPQAPPPPGARNESRVNPRLPAQGSASRDEQANGRQGQDVESPVFFSGARK